MTMSNKSNGESTIKNKIINDIVSAISFSDYSMYNIYINEGHSLYVSITAASELLKQIRNDNNDIEIECYLCDKSGATNEIIKIKDLSTCEVKGFTFSLMYLTSSISKFKI